MENNRIFFLSENKSKTIHTKRYQQHFFPITELNLCYCLAYWFCRYFLYLLFLHPFDLLNVLYLIFIYLDLRIQKEHNLPNV